MYRVHLRGSKPAYRLVFAQTSLHSLYLAASDDRQERRQLTGTMIPHPMDTPETDTFGPVPVSPSLAWNQVP
jgi:hypothetical protein